MYKIYPHDEEILIGFRALKEEFSQSLCSVIIFYSFSWERLNEWSESGRVWKLDIHPFSFSVKKLGKKKVLMFLKRMKKDRSEHTLNEWSHYTQRYFVSPKESEMDSQREREKWSWFLTVLWGNHHHYITIITENSIHSFTLFQLCNIHLMKLSLSHLIFWS